MHGIQEMSRSVRLASPVVLHLAVGEIIVDFLRMHDAALAHEIQQEFGSLSARGRPWQAAFGRGAAIGTRMHVRLQSPGHETVVDKEIFVDAELCVATFEIAGAVILDAMTQDQVLSARWSANGIGLDETHAMESTL